MQHNTLLYRFFFDPLAHGIACMVVAYLVAPAQFVKVVYQETGQSYSAIITNCIRAKNFKFFFSGAHIYALRQFIAALAFGVSQWLFLCSTDYYPITNFTLLVIWECFLAGMVETVVTIYSETKEIAANKGALMKRKEKVMDVLTPILLRNILSASACILAYEFTKDIHGIWMNMVVSTLLGIAVSALTMPFDLIATQNCGSEVPMTWIGRLKHNITVEKNFLAIFNGLTMRIVQIVPYSVAHSLVMLFLGQS
ncbi:hypothetical protein [Cardinium endosymbiont of Dermatophagoides farinae]|uniref:hypothetical protein n=1 Tax=Cardinium endosymbiont of Dermatophagoides farinae TaxID=2597823 RepID=UPI001183A053|nr:hypothetical protein [Cardinium endosymbiont of Dermatophagoides farinae]TSJ80557.1 hypothetical protein FPG78_00460 [Cardinium endosymbiont of Dermatophagoides farinae]